MGTDYIAAAWRVKGLTSSQRVVLLAYCDCANNETGECWPGTAFMADRCEMSLRNMERRTAELIALGVMRGEATFDSNGAQRATHYFIQIEGLPHRRQERKTRRQAAPSKSPVPDKPVTLPPGKVVTPPPDKAGPILSGTPRQSERSPYKDEPLDEPEEPVCVNDSPDTEEAGAGLEETHTGEASPEEEKESTTPEVVAEWVAEAERLTGKRVEPAARAQTEFHAAGCARRWRGCEAAEVLGGVTSRRRRPARTGIR